MNQIFSMKLSEFDISLLVESYDTILPKFLRCRKAHSFQTIKRYRFQILIAQIEDMNEDCVKISRRYVFAKCIKTFIFIHKFSFL